MQQFDDLVIIYTIEALPCVETRLKANNRQQGTHKLVLDACLGLASTTPQDELMLRDECRRVNRECG